MTAWTEVCGKHGTELQIQIKTENEAEGDGRQSLVPTVAELHTPS